jgi:nucleoid DNA-binding protein
MNTNEFTTYLGNIIQQLQEGRVVEVAGFGILRVEKHNESISVDSSTHRRMLLPPRLVVTYTDGAEGTLTDALFLAIRSELTAHGEADLPGFGTFRLSTDDVTTFTPCETLRRYINRPFEQFEAVQLNDGVEFEDTEEVEVASSTAGVVEETSAETSTHTIGVVEETAAPVAAVPTADVVTTASVVVETAEPPVVTAESPSVEALPADSSADVTPTTTAAVVEETATEISTQTAAVVEETPAAPVTAEAPSVEAVPADSSADTTPTTASSVVEATAETSSTTAAVVEEAPAAPVVAEAPSVEAVPAESGNVDTEENPAAPVDDPLQRLIDQAVEERQNRERIVADIYRRKEETAAEEEKPVAPQPQRPPKRKKGLSARATRRITNTIVALVFISIFACGYMVLKMYFPEMFDSEAVNDWGGEDHTARDFQQIVLADTILPVLPDTVQEEEVKTDTNLIDDSVALTTLAAMEVMNGGDIRPSAVREVKAPAASPTNERAAATQQNSSAATSANSLKQQAATQQQTAAAQQQTAAAKVAAAAAKQTATSAAGKQSTAQQQATAAKNAAATAKPAISQSAAQQTATATKQSQTTTGTAAKSSQAALNAPVHPDSVSYKVVGTKATHVLQPGETLTRVSLKYYGTKDLYPYIVQYNKKILANPNNVPVGTSLLIPELQKK